MPAKRHHQGATAPVTGARTVASMRLAWRRVTCPLCKSGPGRSCMSMTSWTFMEGYPGGGFYARRRQAPHSERVEVARQTEATASERGALRKEINSVVQRKLAAGQRMVLRQWMAQPSRTVDELKAKLAELNSMADLAW